MFKVQSKNLVSFAQFPGPFTACFLLAEVSLVLLLFLLLTEPKDLSHKTCTLTLAKTIRESENALLPKVKKSTYPQVNLLPQVDTLK